ncbi:MAG: trehalose-6-phosphate synthase [Thermoleophilia bacterium]
MTPHGTDLLGTVGSDADLGSGSGLVVLANRLPLTRGARDWEPACGGLATALVPTLRALDGVWVGAESRPEGLTRAAGELGLRVAPVPLPPTIEAGYYDGFSNRTLWPLLHGGVERPVLSSDWWRDYRAANERLATGAMQAAEREGGSAYWVHDYHLLRAPAIIRRRAPRARVGFFLHVPFPEPAQLAALPWAREILTGMLGADLVAFQTAGHRDRFLDAVALVLGPDAWVSGDGVVLRDGRLVRVEAHPISIDADGLVRHARSPEAARELRALARRYEGRTVLLGVDRLDYTKGIPERLLALEELLERRPDLRGRVVLVQVGVPTRTGVPEYRRLAARVRALAERLTARASAEGLPSPVELVEGPVPPARLHALLALADVALVTPLADGMNLVAKEYAVVQAAAGGTGALVLSRAAGASEELRDAVPCDPTSTAGIARAIESALALEPDERRARLARMAAIVHARTPATWAGKQLATLVEPALRSAPGARRPGRAAA